MKVLIFTEGNSQIGLGHITRCSSLFNELDRREVEVELIINGNEASGIGIIQNKKFKIINWLSVDFLNHYINSNDYCIVDSYLASEELYKVISSKSNRCLYIDDNARIKYPKGIVVNPALYTGGVKYPESDGNCYLLGSEYIILRRPFIEAKRRTIKKTVKEVLITFGGSDIRNLTPIVLKQLSSKHPEMSFKVIIGNAYKNINIENMRSKNINFYKYANAEEMKKIMLKSDVAITAAGQTIYELLATQTPFIPIKIIENQSNNIYGLTKLHLINNVLDYEDASFLYNLDIIFNDLLNNKKRKHLADKYKKVIDGLGTKRIIDFLLGWN